MKATEKKINNEYVIERNIGKRDNVFILTRNNNHYFAKFKKNPRHATKFLSQLMDLIGFTNILFEKELAILQSLNKISFNSFKYPKLVDSDNRTYFITEYIDGKSQIKLNKYTKESIIEALTEFHKHAHLMQLHKSHKFISFLVKPMSFILRTSVTNVLKYCGPTVAVKVLALSAKMVLRNNKQSNFILSHSDIRQEVFIEYPDDNVFFQNLMIDKNEKIYFIDFGSTVILKRFFMIDIVNLAFNARKEKLNWQWIKDFLKNMDSWISYTESNLKDQIRIALLINILNRIYGAKYRKESILFLRKIILSDAGFDSWYKGQISV